MRNSTMLVATLFAATSFPLLAQQSPSGDPSMSPGSQSGSPMTPPGSVPESRPTSPGDANQSPSTTSQASAAAASPAVEMRPVKAELVSKLDSKTAKSGDDVVVQTNDSVTTAAGTEIPKGSKLVGHVVAVQPSTGGQNSQVVLQFDQAQVKGGASVPIRSEIKSIAPAGGAASASGFASPGSGSAASGEAGAAGSATAPGAPGSAATPGAAGTAPTTPGYAQGAAGAGAPAGEAAAGEIVARNGNIAIHRTSVPGVLLANNAPGEQDPRMAQVSGILLGAKRDVQLEGGTQLVVDVAATGAGSK